uniref:Uncharacterized protein n=1 Tax=Utricularia reniformis TaxID=192314 RepID=A0A1Y0B1U5_9LAMI|nr:hypothetical protein AEK19_MT1127 [Utricularia reniformis]ART31343.1 hypothetical protein AEK19_MT1127 [Utricularia reniformis]
MSKQLGANNQSKAPPKERKEDKELSRNQISYILTIESYDTLLPYSYRI